MAAAQAGTAPTTVTVGFEGPERQQRLTVAFRLALALPHFLYLWVLTVVAIVATMLGWLAALVLGRLPRGIATFVGRVVQYGARVNAYGQLLLTDRYPRFALDAPDYPVSVDLAPGRLNRMAVLFRLVLVVPAAIVSSLVGAGLYVAAVFIWLIALVTARLPRPLFEAEAAVLRYQVRFYAYLAMLTSEYPRGLFGDDAGPPPAASPAGLVLPDAPPAPPPLLPTHPSVTRLVLSRAGRRLVVLFLVLGIVFQVGGNITLAVTAAKSHGTAGKLADAQKELGAAVQRFSTEAQSCALSGGPECIHAADTRLAEAFARFGDQLRALPFPPGALPLASKLEQDTSEIVALLRQLASTSTPAEYQAGAGRYQTLANQFDADYRALANALL